MVKLCVSLLIVMTCAVFMAGQAGFGTGEKARVAPPIVGEPPEKAGHGARSI